ncbi:MAG: amidohydrolase [Deltaproteobacteria bacterium]|nr:amidohydrolase [Deltaproteobacteria bacterium]
MIIDAHCHVWTWDIISENYWNALADIAVDYLKRMGMGELTREQVKKDMLDGLMDTDGSKLIASLDNAGIDMAYIMALDWGYGIGEPRKSVNEINEFYGSLAKAYPDRIIAFAGVDPRRPDAVDILDRAINEYGCRGLKYHPTVGFFPDGEESYKVLEKAQELDIPLLSHTGPISKPFKSKYAQPIYLDAIISDFPSLRVIAAHMGFCWWHELVNLVAAKATTFYADISGQQVLANRNFSAFCHMLREAIDEASADKFLWGTDNPVLELVLPIKNWLQMIQDLPENAPDGIVFTKQEIDAILGGNAMRLFGL